MLYSLRKMLVKPRFGMRRCSGIWPPSNPRIMREPLRERCPLWPRVEVLPMPEPMPRPTRLRFSVAFFGARIFDKFISKLSVSAAAFSHELDALETDAAAHTASRLLHQMRHLRHHAANRRRVRRSITWFSRVKPSPLITSLCFTGAQIAERTHFSCIFPLPAFVFFAVISNLSGQWSVASQSLCSYWPLATDH